MLTQSLPPSAEAYATTQRAQIAAAVAAVRRQWRRVRAADIDASYLQVERTVLAVVTTAQTRVALGAQEYVPAVLAQTGQARAVEAFATVSTTPLVGVAGDGRPARTLLFGAVTHAKSLIDRTTGPGLSPTLALTKAGDWMSMAVGTLLSDTGRQSEALAMGVRPVSGYVRMLTPPSCSRCVVLAGKWFAKSTGFARHPGCDCRHIPASEIVAGDLTVSPAEYFDALTPAAQDATFTKAGAEAIRGGADVNQVVNARRGMGYAGRTSTATREMWVRKPDGRTVWEPRVVNVTHRHAQTVTVAGRSVLLTTEGTTRRGNAYRYLGLSGARRPRLMPETIARIATGRDDYLRLLRANGYLY